MSRLDSGSAGKRQGQDPILSRHPESRPVRTRFHLPRRREPGGGGDPLSQPMSDAGAGSCRYKGLGAAAERPRAQSAQRGPVGGREGGREERTHYPARDRPDRRPAAEGKAAEISVGKSEERLLRPHGAALRAPSTTRPLPPSTCRRGLAIEARIPRLGSVPGLRGRRRLHLRLCSVRSSRRPGGTPA